MPKPTYNKPPFDIDFIKGSKKDDKYLNSLVNIDDNPSSEGHDSFSGKTDEILKMMGSTNIKENTSVTYDSINPNQDSFTFDYTYTNKDYNKSKSHDNNQFNYYSQSPYKDNYYYPNKNLNDYKEYYSL